MTRRRAAAGAGAAAVRARAGDTRRAKVQTIHAFCTQLLHQFPFEANVAARFSVLDETEQTQLLEQLTLHVLLDRRARPDSALGRALAAAMTPAADQTFRDVVRAAIGRREAIARWVGERRRRRRGDRRFVARARRRSGDTPRGRRGGILRRVRPSAVGMGRRSPRRWRVAARPTSNRRARFSRARARCGADRVEAYLEIFCTDDRRAAQDRSSPRPIKDPGLASDWATEQERVCALRERRNAVICRDRSAALLTVAYAVLTRYHDEKERRGLLDYDDLIDKTLSLLDQRRRRLGALQARSRHRSSADRRGAGHQRQAVGDRARDWSPSSPPARARARSRARSSRSATRSNRSIRSRTRRRSEFAQMRRHFQRAHADAGLEFVFGEFEHSFRSGDSVLGRRRRGVQGEPHRGERDLRYRRLPAAYRAARRAAEHGRDLGADEARPSARRSKAGMRRSIPSARRARASSSPSASRARCAA